MTRWQGYMNTLNTPRASVKSMRSKSWASHWREQSWVAAGVQASTLLLPGDGWLSTSTYPLTFPSSSRPQAPQRQRTNFLLPYMKLRGAKKVIRKLQLWNDNPHCLGPSRKRKVRTENSFFSYSWNLADAHNSPCQGMGSPPRPDRAARSRSCWRTNIDMNHLPPRPMAIRNWPCDFGHIYYRTFWKPPNWFQCMIPMVSAKSQLVRTIFLVLPWAFLYVATFKSFANPWTTFHFSRPSCVSVTKSQARRKARMKS